MKKHPTNKLLIDVIIDGEKYSVPYDLVQHWKKSSISINDDMEDDGSIEVEEYYRQRGEKLYDPPNLLRGYRYREELSQTAFAKKIGVSQSDLSKMETGKRPIGKTIAKRIAKFLDTDYRIFLS